MQIIMLLKVGWHGGLDLHLDISPDVWTNNFFPIFWCPVTFFSHSLSSPQDLVEIDKSWDFGWDIKDPEKFTLPCCMPFFRLSISWLTYYLMCFARLNKLCINSDLYFWDSKTTPNLFGSILSNDAVGYGKYDTENGIDWPKGRSIQ